jgi:addiction module HigA family antidote
MGVSQECNEAGSPGRGAAGGFLKLLRMSANALAKAVSVPAPEISDVIRQQRGISADTAMRLARYFGGDARSWLTLSGRPRSAGSPDQQREAHCTRGFARRRLIGDAYPKDTQPRLP